jgi:hypothetical protein
LRVILTVSRTMGVEMSDGVQASEAPTDWATIESLEVLEVSILDGTGSRRFQWRNLQDAAEHEHTELMWPVYVPTSTPAEGGAAAVSAASADTSAASTADQYWSDATTQARTAAKWIATSLGAALAAIIGTAPLTPLSGKTVDWFSGPGLALALGIISLGVAFFLVISVLVPGVTFFADLMTQRREVSGIDEFFNTSSALNALAKRAGEQGGVQLPIGVSSLAELGHRIRLEEMTLDKISAKLVADSEENIPDGTLWTAMKVGRGQILQNYLSESTRWAIVASYIAVKVRTDRARTAGLALGLVGAMAVVWGYIGIQPNDVQPTADLTTYVVLSVDATSVARTKLGTKCDAFTAVRLNGTSLDKVPLYVTGGTNCKTGRVDLPVDEIATLEPVQATDTTSSSPPATTGSS